MTSRDYADLFYSRRPARPRRYNDLKVWSTCAVALRTGAEAWLHLENAQPLDGDLRDLALRGLAAFGLQALAQTEQHLLSSSLHLDETALDHFEAPESQASQLSY